ncbi:hypothetical protein EV651_11721 [Kribbella sp. VKM Ac-2571]|nr:hypothetical protein EV651_11721 [Kribbella sp. VKM Ac-2571]
MFLFVPGGPALRGTVMLSAIAPPYAPAPPTNTHYQPGARSDAGDTGLADTASGDQGPLVAAAIPALGDENCREGQPPQTSAGPGHGPYRQPHRPIGRAVHDERFLTRDGVALACAVSKAMAVRPSDHGHNPNRLPQRERTERREQRVVLFFPNIGRGLDGETTPGLDGPLPHRSRRDVPALQPLSDAGRPLDASIPRRHDCPNAVSNARRPGGRVRQACCHKPKLRGWRERGET